MLRDIYSDKDLIALIAKKDGRAFSNLYDRYYRDLVTAAFRRIPDECIVEEIVQDVFMVIWAKANTLDLSGDIRGFIFAVLRNKVLYELRTRASQKAKASFYKLKDDLCHTNALDILQAKELEGKIYALIDELSPQSREAFKLSRFEDMSYKMIAERMNISVGTVEKHISKALVVLRKEVGEFNHSIVLLFVVYLFHQLLSR